MVLRRVFGGSIERALRTIYPSVNWQSSRFLSNSSTMGGEEQYWMDIDKRREFLDDLAQTLHLKEPEDWYRVSHTAVSRRGGLAMLKNYHSSLILALVTLYPEYHWQLWEEIESVRRNLDIDRVGKDAEAIQAWHRVKQSTVLRYITQSSRNSIATKFGGSLVKALAFFYPNYRMPKLLGQWKQLYSSQEHNNNNNTNDRIHNNIDSSDSITDDNSNSNSSDDSKTPTTTPASTSYLEWTSPSRQRLFLDLVAQQFQLKSAEDWCSVTNQDIIDRGGIGLLAQHGGMLYKALQQCYSGEVGYDELKPWQFEEVPHSFWANEENVRYVLPIYCIIIDDLFIPSIYYKSIYVCVDSYSFIMIIQHFYPLFILYLRYR